MGAGRARVGVDEALARAERCPRVRAARATRARLRQGEVVALVYPPWSDVEGFLDDLRVDLAVADRPLRCVALRSLEAGLGGALAADAYACWTPASAEEARAAAGALAAWRERAGGAALLVGWPERLGAPPAGVTAVPLPDHDEDEAVDYLAGFLGGHATQLRPLARRLGGLPALLREAARGGVSEPPDARVERAWAAIAGEVRAALAPLSRVPALQRRLAALADGPQPLDAEADALLRAAGMVAIERGATRLRSPRMAG